MTPQSQRKRPSTGILRKPAPAVGHRVAYGDLQRPRARPASTGPYSATNMTAKVTVVARPKTALGRTSFNGTKPLNQAPRQHVFPLPLHPQQLETSDPSDPSLNPTLIRSDPPRGLSPGWSIELGGKTLVSKHCELHERLDIADVYAMPLFA